MTGPGPGAAALGGESEQPELCAVSTFTVPAADAPGFRDRAEVALAALSVRPGFQRGRVAVAPDEPTTWLLLTEWDNVGSYRRGLGGVEVRIAMAALYAEAVDAPSAFEVRAAR